MIYLNFATKISECTLGIDRHILYNYENDNSSPLSRQTKNVTQLDAIVWRPIVPTIAVNHVGLQLKSQNYELSSMNITLYWVNPVISIWVIKISSPLFHRTPPAINNDHSLIFEVILILLCP